MEELLIGGGGVNGFIYLGVLEYLDRLNLLNIKKTYGTSIGSLITVLYACGCKPIEILNNILNKDLNKFVNYNLSNINKNYIIDNNLLENLLDCTIMKLIDENTTFDKFYKDKKIDINVCVTNITTNNYEMMNKKNTPNIKVKDAIRASMSLPFLFEPVEINNNYYIDGCCKNLYGTTPDDDYILGYSIIASDKHKNFIEKILNSVISGNKPRSTYTIECDSIGVDMYSKLNDKQDELFLKLYKEGIEIAKGKKLKENKNLF